MLNQKIEVVGKIPSKSNRYKIIRKKRFNGSAHYSLAKTKVTRSYEQFFMFQIKKFRPPHPVHVPFKLVVDCHFCNSNNDLDNAFKFILDCLEHVEFIKNDRLCHQIEARKHVDKENPRLIFSIHLL